MKLLAVQRRDKIRELLLEKENITVSEIVDKFGISVETVRRDFNVLESEGFLDKIYGGAVLKRRTAATPNKTLMMNALAENKTRVANRAVRFMKTGDTIFLDNSPAVAYMCPGLMNLEITVLTNSLYVISHLSKSKTVKLIATGGMYDPVEDAFFGSTALENLRKFHVDRAFFSCKSFDMEHGVMTSNENLADMGKAIIKAAQQTCLLVDHSKFDKVSFVHLCNFEAIHRLFTDEIISDEWRTFFERRGVKVYECTAKSEEADYMAESAENPSLDDSDD